MYFVFSCELLTIFRLVGTINTRSLAIELAENQPARRNGISESRHPNEAVRVLGCIPGAY